MSDNRIQPTEEMSVVEFKTAFKGYSIPEVNDYIAEQIAEIEDIRSENAELYKRIEKLTRHLQKYAKSEAERKKKIEEAKEEADKIIRDAKKRAAQELLRTSRKCARMISDMTEQVDEQKRLYEATKIEAAKFRREIFSLYRNHIELINAMSEASGAFDGDAYSVITDEDLADMEKLLDENQQYEEVDQSAFSSVDGEALLVEAFSDTASITIPHSAKGKGGPKKEEKKTVKKAEFAPDKAEKGKESVEADLAEEDYDDLAADIEDEVNGSEDFLYDETAKDTSETLIDNDDADDDEFDGYYEDDSDDEWDVEDSDFDEEGEPEDTTFIITEEDLDEFTNPDGKEMEYDGTVSVDTVFKKRKQSDADFEKLYGDRYEYETDEIEDAPVESAPVRSQKRDKKNSYGFNVSSQKKRNPDDDSNEFYLESDAEFDHSATDGVPTGTVSSFGITSKAPSSERRWKVKKSKSLTDEFDVIKAEADED